MTSLSFEVTVISPIDEQMVRANVVFAHDISFNVKIWQIFVNFCVINIFEERVATDGKKYLPKNAAFEYSNKNVSLLSLAH